jgi:hypothetical protein
MHVLKSSGICWFLHIEINEVWHVIGTVPLYFVSEFRQINFIKTMKHHRRYLASYFILAALFASIFLTSGCSSSSTSTGNGSNVAMQSQLAASDASGTMSTKGATASFVDFDSIVVTKALVFVSDVKLHSDQDDSESDEHDQTIKTGPFVLVFDSSGTHVVTTATIPPGTYDRIKFEFHKPDNNADAMILTEFPELESQTTGQTYTTWIYGYTVKAGVRTSFTVTSTASENVTVRFEDRDFNDRDNIVLTSSTLATMAFEFDPRIVFHLGGGLLGSLFDPRDMTDHQHDIDDNVLIAIRVVEF